MKRLYFCEKKMRIRVFIIILAFACGTLCTVNAKQPMNLIPAQTFIMGNQSGSGRSDALPVHPVTLDSYYMSPHLVTVQQYCNFLNESGLLSDWA